MPEGETGAMAGQRSEARQNRQGGAGAQGKVRRRKQGGPGISDSLPYAGGPAWRLPASGSGSGGGASEAVDDGAVFVLVRLAGRGAGGGTAAAAKEAAGRGVGGLAELALHLLHVGQRLVQPLACGREGAV